MSRSAAFPGYDIHNRMPYTDEWMLSIERQAGPNTVFSASYVGTSSHRQRVLDRAQPGNPALCLSLSQPSEVQPGTLTCGPGGEDTVYYPIGGGQVNGTRGPLGQLRQQCAAIHHRPRQLQRNGTERSSHQRTAGVLCRLYLQQVAGSVLEHRRRKSIPSIPRSAMRSHRST